ncbi:MAG: sulfatase-like hydrolase/transferase [Pacificimonas sp.]
MVKKFMCFAMAALLGACQSAMQDEQDSKLPTAGAEGQPNIVLILFEDMSPRIGAFGDPVATTPVLDEFAETSIRFPNSFTTAGVCAPSRSSLITGVHQQTLGTHQMRTNSPVASMSGGGPIEYEAVPPPDVKAFPELLRAAGYFTTNFAKTDYQFGEPFTIWDRDVSLAEAANPDAFAPQWRERADGQPFFSMFTIFGTHESFIWPEDRESDNPLVAAVTARNRAALAGKPRVTDPADVEVPPYLPDTPVVRADIARHYDNIAFAERQLQQILDWLIEDDLLGDTIVIVTTDHGDGLPRMKRSVYDSGLRVPLMLRLPNGESWGAFDDRLVSFVDLAPTILAWADADLPDWLQGRRMLSGALRDYIFATTDRVDTLPDRSKAVRDERFKYIRNYRNDVAYLRPLPFRDAQPTTQEIWRLAAAGELTPIQRQLIEAPRPPEELYDTKTDPHEVQNLIDDPAYAETLLRLRSAMDEWLARTPDLSAMDERAMIESMWPGGVQPTTAAPRIASRNGQRVTLASPTPGASIAYGFGDAEPNRLYTEPLGLPSDVTQLTVKAIRYGYAPSETATISLDGGP